MEQMILLAAWTAFLISLAVSVIHFNLWIRLVQVQALMYWAVAWGLYAARFALDGLERLYPTFPLWNILLDISTCFAGVFFAYGVWQIRPVARRWHKYPVLVATVISIWSIINNLFGASPQLSTVFSSFFLGLMQIYVGYFFLRFFQSMAFWPSLGVGCSMILAGLHKFDYPFLRYFSEIAPYGYWITSALTVATAVSMLLISLQRMSRERDILFRRYKALFENTRDIILLIDLDGRIVDANPMAIQTYGYTANELKQLSIYDLHHSETEGEVDRLIREADTGGILVRVHHRHKNGELIPVEVSSIGSAVNGNRILFTIIRNLTEQQRMQAMYEATFESTGTAMLIVEADLTIVLVNREFEKITGYARQEVVGMAKLPDLIVPAQRGRLKSDLHKFCKELTLITKDGRPIEVLCTIQQIPGTTQSVVSWLDITERIRAEEQVRYLSFHDKLTGLYNRAYFEEQLQRLDVPRQLPLAIIMGDVNGLKLVNDAFGHAVGDQLLVDVARILKSSARQEDIIARWGGDEFIILLPQTSESQAAAVAARIKRNCAQFKTANLISLSIALGVAAKSSPEQLIHDVIQVAEDRMYRDKLLEARNFRSSLLTSLMKSLKELETETEEHTERLKELALKIGVELGLTETQLNELALLAALHDIGKLGIPDELLRKPGPLTPEEWEIVKRHPEIGYRIASSDPDLVTIADAILAHHERMDGTGYPRGLKNEQIPLNARILAVCDAYDVMVYGCSYKERLTEAEAVAEIQRCAGTQFDPRVVEAFLKVVKDRVAPAESDDPRFAQPEPSPSRSD